MIRSIRSKGRSRGAPEIQIAPMIDLMFTLLIFFVVTTSFVRETGIAVQRPQSSTASTVEKSSVLVGIGRLLMAKPVRHAMRDAPGEVGPAILALLVVLPLVFAAAGSYVSAGLRLFGASTTELLLAAPLRRASIVAHALLRAYLSALWLAMTIGLPAVVLFGARYGVRVGGLGDS